MAEILLDSHLSAEIASEKGDRGDKNDKGGKEGKDGKDEKPADDSQHAIGSPSYKDLVEENQYLRSERSQLYDELARVASGSSSSTETSKLAGCHCAALTETLQTELTKERTQNKKFISHFEYLKNEIAHLQVHGSEQASVAKSLEERLEQAEEGLHAANSELLQILPLRIKLNEMRQKMELTSQESLVTNNEVHEVRGIRDKLQMSLDASNQLLEATQMKLNSAMRKNNDFKTDRKDLLTQIKALEDKLMESTTLNDNNAVIIKQQEERITEIATDSAHWERKSSSLSRELGRFSGSQIQQVTQYTELKEAYAVLKSKLQLREEAINSMIEQSRQSRQQQKPIKRTLVTACVSGTPGPPATHPATRWPTDTSHGTPHNAHGSNMSNKSNATYVSNLSAKSNTKGKIVFQNTEIAEELKLMMDSSNRDQGDEDYDDTAHSHNDMCSICDTFSFLSSSNDRNKNYNSSYGMI